jgi:uncharacterized membrane protein YhaH (DUF805 family)
MFASIVIVILGILFGSLSIIVQYTKDRERRKKVEGAVLIPAVLALFGVISWLMSHAHHLDDLGVSMFALMMALAFFILIPAVTYPFSPAFKEAGDDPHQPQVHSQNHTAQQSAQWDPRPPSPNPCRSIVALRADEPFIIDGVVMDDGETFQAPRLTQ